MGLGLGLGLVNKERSKEDQRHYYAIDGKLGHHSQVDLNMGLYSATNLPKRGVAILKIPAVPYASPMAIDYNI